MNKLNFFRVYIFIGLLTITGCKDSMETIEFEDSESIDFTDEVSIKYLALGDSYTIGLGVSEADRWPVQLSKRIEQEISLNVGVDIIAQSGWTTSDLLRSINSYTIDSGDYNLVSLLIGVNNQYLQKPFSLYEDEFDSLLQMSIKIAGDEDNVFVVSIPDYGVTPFGSDESELIAQEIDQYNAYAKSKCVEADVAFINITSISRELGASSGALVSDGLHPSAYQYSLWTDRILSRVLDLIDE